MDDEELKDEDFVSEKGIDVEEGKGSRALLVSIYSGGDNLQSAEEYLEELAALANTYGIDVFGKFPCAVRTFNAATLIPKGKLEEITLKAQELGCNLVVFDDEITPAQQRNLEKALKVAVMDRTELILEIFAQRAQTKEAQLQIKLAKTKYEFPRLKRLWSHFSRQRMSGGYLKGEGEKQIEIDRRLLKKKLEKLKRELDEVKKARATQRSRRIRSGVPTFAILGYTNAGKSTLLNALTNANVLVEDKLFATLDPTTRKFILPNNQEVLLTDTVGFIRKLPHTLVAAFRSTLETAVHDDVLLHLIDVSNPMAFEQAKTTRALLYELGAEESSIITVLNKVELVQDRGIIHRLKLTYRKTVEISALEKKGFEDLTEIMMRALRDRLSTVHLRIPQSDYGLVARIKEMGHVTEEIYEENDILLRAEIPFAMISRFSAYRIPAEVE